MDAERIPDDILATAHDVAFDCGPPSTADEVARHIARALLAERERAAKIADRYKHRDTGYAIAIAIRTPSPATSE